MRKKGQQWKAVNKEFWRELKDKNLILIYQLKKIYLT